MTTTSFMPTNNFAGKQSSHTKNIDLSPNADKFGIITGVKVIWSNYIVGMEFLFGGQSAGVVRGSHNQNIWEEVFNVQQGDYIVQVFGRASNVITCLGFKTAKGLTKVWGNPLEGDSWTFGLNGQYIKALRLGVEEYLVYAEPVYEDEMFLNAQKLNFSQNGKFTTMVGKADHSTEQFDDWDWLSSKFNYSVAEVTLWHDGKYVHGIQFHYGLDGTKKSPGKHCSESNGLKAEKLTLNDNEHITKILIRAGDWVDHITIITDQGRRLSAGGNGGNAYLAVVPQGNHFVAVGGGISQTLRTVQFFYDEIY